MIDRTQVNIGIIFMVALAISASYLYIDRNEWRYEAAADSSAYDLLKEKIDNLNEHDCDRPESEVPEWVKNDFEHLINNGGFSIQFGLAGHSEDVIILSGTSVENFADKIGITWMKRHYIFMVSGDAFLEKKLTTKLDEMRGEVEDD